MSQNDINARQIGGCDPATGCCGGLDRRDFLKFMGAGAAGALLAKMPAMAGPFTVADFDKIVPSDKKLKPEWIAALYARGEREVWRGAALGKIGMPVGGLCAGQLYLGGDGTLWHWDIFNQRNGTGDAHYAHPMQPASPLAQGFALKVRVGGQTQTRPLDGVGFPEVSFCGEYPFGFVTYKDPELPVTVSLEAFSPFVPLATGDSSLPATVMRFTVKNTSQGPVEAELAGWLQNSVGKDTGNSLDGTLVNRIARGKGLTLLDCSARVAQKKKPVRPSVTFADFEGGGYGKWQAEGNAFGEKPVRGTPDKKTQHLSGYQGRGLVNTWRKSDESQGTLTSPEFTIERPCINFLIGGGDHKSETCINLLVEGKAVRTSTGRNSDAMAWTSWDVDALRGRRARIEIVDRSSSGWGHIDIDQIEFADSAPNTMPFHQRPDTGTMTLALLGAPAETAAAALAEGKPSEMIFSTGGKEKAESPLGSALLGGLGRRLSLAPGAEATVTFAVTWHFPNWRLDKMQDVGGRYYATRFADAAEVARHLAKNFDSLYRQTRLWHETWYDSTLPRWFLNRTFLNTSILATSTCYRLASGRFWAWEGVGCCPGTCTHVWHYAHAPARLFPDLERDLRERVDLGISFHPETGVIGFRGEFIPGESTENLLAVDGQAGNILRAYREHLMSADSAFLRRIWPRLRKAFDPLLALDPNRDGILEGPQHNTLDRPWFGQVAWLSSLYVAALRAGEAMAREMDDVEFAEDCRAIAERGSKAIDQRLFNGEYYYQRPDPKKAKTVGSFDGCEIDQVFGQSWAFQVALGRILPREHVHSALRALWKYNFTPDAGAYRATHKEGRWYAMAGEAGLLMCSWPRGEGSRNKGDFDGYFNECMNGFEYQVAGHMIWEGMVQEGLAITRALHDRYHPLRRNPWNEVECGDHYARSMASYGVYLAACGFELHGPQGHLGFAPRLAAEDFRAAFTAPEGWGTLSQKREGDHQKNGVQLRWGTLRLKTLALDVPEALKDAKAAVTLDGKPLAAAHELKDGRLRVALNGEITLKAGQTLEVAVG